MTKKKSARGLRILGTLFGLSLFGAAALAWPTTSVGIAGPTEHLVITPDVAPRALTGLAQGGEMIVTGSVRTSNDGTVFDAARRTDGVGAKAITRPGGWFETDRAGLRVSDYDEKTRTVHLVASGANAPACSEAGFASPCLIPRMKVLAQERLLSQADFAQTLTGSMNADLPTAPTVAVEAPSHALSVLAGSIGALLLAWLLVSARREKRETLLAQVHAAAKKARAATTGDITLAELAKKVTRLVERAEHLDETRKALETRVAAIDVIAIERKKQQIEAAKSDQKKDVLEVLAREVQEIEKLHADLAAATAGLERILAALRVIPLSTRTDRNVRVKTEGGDDVDAALAELDMREEAEEEASRVIGR